MVTTSLNMYPCVCADQGVALVPYFVEYESSGCFDFVLPYDRNQATLDFVHACVHYPSPAPPPCVVCTTPLPPLLPALCALPLSRPSSLRCVHYPSPAPPPCVVCTTPLLPLLPALCALPLSCPSSLRCVHYPSPAPPPCVVIPHHHLQEEGVERFS